EVGRRAQGRGPGLRNADAVEVAAGEREAGVVRKARAQRRDAGAVVAARLRDRALVARDAERERLALEPERAVEIRDGARDERLPGRRDRGGAAPAAPQAVEAPAAAPAARGGERAHGKGSA